MIAFDTETHLIRPGLAAPPLVCLSLAWETTRPAWVQPGPGALVRGRTALLDRPTALAVLPAMLAERCDDGPALIGANTVFDLSVLAAAAASDDITAAIFDAVECFAVTDVQTRERLYANAFGNLTPALRTNLPALVRRYLGPDRADAMDLTKHGGDVWRLRYSELDGVPLSEWPAAAVDYALDDASATIDVYNAQTARIPDRVSDYLLRLGRNVVTEDREIRAEWALRLQSTWGLRTDPARVPLVISRWREAAARGRAAGTAGGWVRPNGSTNKKVLQGIVSDLYAGHPPRTAACGKPCAAGVCGKAKKHKGACGEGKAGQVKTDNDTLIEAAERDDAPEGLKAYAESLLAAKYMSVWARHLDSATRVPSTYGINPLLVTGRAAVRGPPWQQPPRSGGLTEAEKKAKDGGVGVRDCVIPRPGWVFCSVDYSMAELCALAQLHIWLGLDRTMADVINAGRDLHLVVAANIATAQGRPTTYDEAFELYHAGDPEMKRLRQVSKIANFGFGGGMGAPRFVEHAGKQGVVLSRDGAQEVRDVWMASWPAMTGYFARIARLTANDRRFVVQHPVSGRLHGGVGYTDGCNGYFQGLVADGAKLAAFQLAKAAYVGRGAFRGSRPVLFVHDEVIAELPVDRAAEAAEEMAYHMRTSLQVHMPDVHVSAEPALMSRWYKNAATVRDEAGRVVLWEPR